MPSLQIGLLRMALLFNNWLLYSNLKSLGRFLIPPRCREISRAFFSHSALTKKEPLNRIGNSQLEIARYRSLALDIEEIVGVGSAGGDRCR